MDFNFTSQICTTREQSKRLLALGLKRETADMIYQNYRGHCIGFGYDKYPKCITDLNILRDVDIPAWSLHRLIEMMPNNIIENEKRYDFSLDHGCSLYEYDNINEFGGYEYDCIGTLKNTSNLYDDLINQIEWLIKEGYFNKEYLE